jgi:membrane protease YdiL (CAAX protease family)
MGGSRSPWAIAALVAAALALTFSFTLTTWLVPDPTPEPPLVRTTAWAAVMLGAYTVYRGRRRRRPALPLWQSASPSGWFATTVATAVAALVVGAVAIAVAIPPPGRTHLDLIAITVVAVAGEEALFRGLLWEMVDDALPPSRSHTPLLLGLTTVLFAVTHLQYADFHLTSTAVAQLGYTSVAGLALGLLRLRTGTLLWPLLAHSGGNAILKLLRLVSGDS